MYTITRKSSSRRQSANSMDSDQLMKDDTNQESQSSSSGEEESDEADDESASDSGTSTVTCASLHSRGGISSGSGLTSSSGWSSAGQAVYSPMKLTKRWRKTHEEEAENKLRFMTDEPEMAVEHPSDEEASRTSLNALDLSSYGYGMDYCNDSRTLDVVTNWLDQNHHHAMRSCGPLSPPTTPPTVMVDNESSNSVHRLSEQHLNGMGFLAPSPSASDSSSLSSSLRNQENMSTQVITPKSSPCCSPSTGIKNSQGPNGFRPTFGPLSAPSNSCSSPSNIYHRITNSSSVDSMTSGPLFLSTSLPGPFNQMPGSENGSDQFSCLYLLASAAVGELERQRQLQQRLSPSSTQVATSNAAPSPAIAHTLAVVS